MPFSSRITRSGEDGLMESLTRRSPGPEEEGPSSRTRTRGGGCHQGSREKCLIYPCAPDADQLGFFFWCHALVTLCIREYLPGDDSYPMRTKEEHPSRYMNPAVTDSTWQDVISGRLCEFTIVNCITTINNCGYIILMNTTLQVPERASVNMV